MKIECHSTAIDQEKISFITTIELVLERGTAWTDIECGHLYKAWMEESEDPIIRIYKTSAKFWKKLSNNFCELKTSYAMDKNYNSRSIRPTHEKME